MARTWNTLRPRPSCGVPRSTVSSGRGVPGRRSAAAATTRKDLASTPVAGVNRTAQSAQSASGR